MTRPLSQTNIRHLTERGLDPEIASKLGFTGSDRGETWVEIPAIVAGKVVNRKFRTFGPEKKFVQEPGGKQVLWNFDCLLDQSLKDQPLIITEGEPDTVAAVQSGFPRTVSVPGGAPPEELGAPDKDGDAKRYQFLVDAKDALSSVQEIILAVDGDPQGIGLMNDLAVRLGRHRCKWLRYPKGCKDLNDALKAYGERGVVKTIQGAQWMAVPDIYQMSELPPVAEQRVYDIDLPWRIRLGDFCAVTGIPSAGKSSVLTEIAGRLATKYGIITAFASFEQQPQTDHRRALRTWHARKYVKDQLLEETRLADEWIERHFRFIVPPEDADVTVDWILERAAAAVVQHGARIIVIDPWNELDHIRPGEMTLTEYVGFSIREMRRFAKKYQCHVIVAAHPAKMARLKDGSYPIPSLYDISDSAHWSNKPDLGIIIHRASEDETLFKLAKSRYHDLLGKPGDYSARFSRYDFHYTMLPKDEPQRYTP